MTRRQVTLLADVREDTTDTAVAEYVALVLSAPWGANPVVQVRMVTVEDPAEPEQATSAT